MTRVQHAAAAGTADPQPPAPSRRRRWWSPPRWPPVTRYQGAVTLARLLPRSRLLTLDGWGHVSLPKSSCINAHVSRYLLTTRVPPPGTVCQPDVVPFAQPALQAQTARGPAEWAVGVPPVLRRAVGG